MGKLFSITLLALLLIGCRAKEEYVEVVTDHEEEIYEFGFPLSKYDTQEGTIGRGEFFNNLMIKLGATSQEAYALAEASKGVYDLKSIRVGNGYKAFYTQEEDPKLSYLIYEESKTRYLLFSLKDSVYVQIIDREVQTKLRSGTAVINSSLWNDVISAGMNPLLALRLSDIYAWSIDFFGLQKGDSFSVLYDELYVGDKFLDIGTIYAATFFHGGVAYDAYRFVQDEIPQYWNSKRENLRKAFLKAPLSFTRISSGFTYARRHPVTKVVRPHTGVDYAAPAGTPVMTIGDGVVVQKNYSGGGGNQVKIKHNSTYTTAYLHLSRFAKGLAVGKRVRQGEVIGYVGSTGMSTGPHLDFRVWKNGTPINPLTMESPPADPIKRENVEAFEQIIERSKYLRDSLISIQYIDTLLNKIGVTGY